jgi:thiamine biosynthesis protein ThiS
MQAADTIAIRLNGESRYVPTSYTIASLLDELGLDPRTLVVELNREILRDRSTFGEVTLRDSDVLELVHFVGGG